jgi:hypothetical protein
MRGVAGEIETASYRMVILAGTVHSRAEHDAAVGDRIVIEYR